MLLALLFSVCGGSRGVGGGSLAAAVPAATPRFVYETNQNPNDVTVFTINQTTGTFTHTRSVAASPTPSAVAVDPSGNFCIRDNRRGNPQSRQRSGYTINQTTGALTPVSTALADLLATSIAMVGR
ncbi:beta-propeller fold lactonase family protein [Rhodoferax sp.]|uniref:beta-propeller fold lactonase family protein n=1 Tax=Rhodoferax sp. TaxID=50421 RepID=UPI003868B263